MTDDQTLIDQLLAEAGIEIDAGAPVLRAYDRSAPARLSFAQEVLWLHDNASPGTLAYHMPIARVIAGPLDEAALAAAIDAVVTRHEVLRTRFPLDGDDPVAAVDPARPGVLDVVDLRGVPAAERSQRANETLAELARAPFDVSTDHLFRAALVRVEDERAILLFVLHHLISDGLSIGVLFGEIATLYRARRAGEPAALPHLDVQYVDYARWQRETLAGNRLDELLTYWRGALGDRSQPLELPTDFARPASPTFAGVRRQIVLEPALLDALQRLARANGATLYVVVLAVYATLLHRYTGNTNVLVGSNVAGRMDSRLETLIGYFNHTLAMRGDFAGDPTFTALLARMRESVLGAFDHQDMPLEKLVLELRDADNPSSAPLFDVVLSAQDATVPAFALDGLRVEPASVDLESTKFDQTLFMTQTEQGLRLELYARSDLWLPASIDRMLEHVRTIARAVVDEPERRVSTIPLLSDAERRLVDATNATAASVGARTVLDDVARQCARVAQRTAVACGERSITYAELAAYADGVARDIAARGVAPGTPVGLALERGPHAIAGLLGILRAGCAYVPFDVATPAERVRVQLRESGARVVVTTPERAESFGIAAADVVEVREPAERDAVPARAVGPHDLAYILFTSGSTGVPKGVAVTHGNLANYVHAVARVLADVPRDEPGDGLAALDGVRFGMTTTLAADLGNTALFLALCSGGTLDLVPVDVATDPPRYGEYVRAHALDVVKMTPGHLRALAADGDLESKLPARWLVLGGEALPLDFAEQLVASGRARVLNHYGPTETTVGATTFEVTGASLAGARAFGARTVPIGRPLANVRVHVLDAQREPVPVGVPGELYVAGDGVARGYHGRPELTAERFVAPAEGERAYRTGDRVRMLPDGTLEYLGRVDAQLKVRGYRVEPGEIEAALRALPAIAEAAVVPRGDVDVELVAYVTAADRGADAHALRAAAAASLAARLPEYMVPRRIEVLDGLPRTRNGKLDVRALPDLESDAPARVRTEPRTETERALLAIWADVLKRDAATIDVEQDEFLALGGHSLLAIRALGKVSGRFGVRLPLGAIFEHPTLARLAAHIDALASSAAATASGVVPIPRAISRVPRGDAARSDGIT